MSSMEANSRLSAAHLVNSVGDGCFYVAGAVVFHRLLGLSAAEIGLALTVAWTAGFLGTTPVGRVTDRVGARPVAVALSLVTAVATAGMLLTTGPVSFTGVAVVYAVAQSGLGVARQALVVALVDAGERTRFRARLQVWTNVGIGLGAVLGGLALLADTSAAYTGVLVLDAWGFLLAGLLLTRLPAPRLAAPVAPVAPGAPERTPRRVWHDRPYLTVAGLHAVLYLYMPTLSVVLPLFVAARTAAPAWTIAVAFVVNTAGVLALQVRAGRRVTGIGSAAASSRRGGVAIAVSCLIFGLAALPHEPVLAAVVVLVGAAVQVVGEVAFAAGSWELGFALAAPDHPGQWQGVFGAGIPVARAVGPLLLTVAVVDWDGPGWLVLASVLLVAAALIPSAARQAARRRVPSHPARSHLAGSAARS
jgi:MFS family permease